MQNFGTWIRLGITATLLSLTAIFLFVAFEVLGAAPARDPNGNLVDKYQRAKDILQAHAVANKTQTKLQGVLDSTQEQGLLEKAKSKYPEAFEQTQFERRSR